MTDAELTASSAIYASYVEDIGRIGSRHETVRAFYITLLTALFTFLASAEVHALLGGIGVAVCFAWALHMRTFREIYKKKFDALREIEKNLPLKPFTAEGTPPRVHVTAVDQGLAVVVGVLFVLLWVLKD